MATPGRTQKQIAERYKGNLGYYKRKHPWRVARFIVSFLALAGGLAAILVYQSRIFRKQASEEFFSSGRISSHHAKYEQDCAQCHDKNAAMGNELTFAKFKSVIKDRFHSGIDFKSIDLRCEACHEKNPPFGTKKEYDLHEPNVVENRACSICHQEHLGPGPMKKVADSQCASCHNDRATMEASAKKEYDLHEPNVIENRACSICHQEHLGPGPMKKVADSQCASCHNDRGIMEASAKKGTTLPKDVFHLRPQLPQQIVFARPRPATGYTQVFSSFQQDHPEFQLIREKAPDPDTLRFNHARHFASDIPPVKGQKLDCNYCHRPDPQGRFYERINFEAHCQSCHALQFDERNPKLHLPHGDVNLVRTFLRTLPAQYAELARTQNEKAPGYNDVKTFIAQQMNGLRRQFGSDAAFENAVFLETDPYKKEDAAPTKANFSGCAHCHAVKMEGRIPVVAKPYLVDRWMPQVNFNHAKHASVSCEECHAQARQSKETSQVLMPDKAKCVACHSPETKKVSSDCITCHTYHAPGQLVKIEVRAEQGDSSFKQMLLGSNAR